MAKKKPEDKLDQAVEAIAKREHEQEKLMAKALDIQNEEAKEVGKLAFFSRILVLATMPHSKTEETVFTRQNGNFKLQMTAHPDYGLPYGSTSRILLAWLSSTAIQRKMSTIHICGPMAGFMRELGLEPTGGKRGTITYFKDHFQRLLSCTVHFTYDGEEQWTRSGFCIANEAELWWKPMRFSRMDPPPSKVELSKPFFEELLKHPIPLDMRAIQALRKSPLAIDIYSWLTYRYHSLKSPVVIPWESLMLQFGGNYVHKHHFRESFLKQLRKVRVVYPKANITEIPGKGMKLWPSPTHVTPTH
ncbi:MAG: pirin [bacterium]|nr:pirin [bacterium]